MSQSARHNRTVDKATVWGLIWVGVCAAFIVWLTAFAA